MGRPRTGKTAPKNRRLSLADRVSMAQSGKLYTPQETLINPQRIQAEAIKATGATISTSKQMSPITKAPSKTEVKRVEPRAVAKAKPSRPVPQPSTRSKSPYGNLAAKIEAQAKKTGTTDIVKKVKLENTKKEETE